MIHDHLKAYKCHYMTRRFWSDVRFRRRVSLDHTSSNNRLTRTTIWRCSKFSFGIGMYNVQTVQTTIFYKMVLLRTLLILFKSGSMRNFSNRSVDKKKWPPQSPDLNPCDFYLWGYLKSVVYNQLPKNWMI